MRSLPLLCLTMMSSLIVMPATSHALKTAASFDINYAYTSLKLSANNVGQAPTIRTLESFSGYEVDYNVALYDLKTMISASFTQFLTSNLGPSPITRLGIGAGYHFIRVNGQRVVLDNQVEGKTWGVSPAVELNLGVNMLAVTDKADFDFNASLFDVLPRFRVEIPLTATVMMLFRVGYLTTFGNSAKGKEVSYKGAVVNLGITLSNL